MKRENLLTLVFQYTAGTYLKGYLQEMQRRENYHSFFEATLAYIILHS